jgi:hypothetical protein
MHLLHIANVPQFVAPVAGKMFRSSRIVHILQKTQ